jgi:hypothetical protein
MEARHTQCEGGRRREAVRNRERERVEGRECWAEGRRRGKEREEGGEGEKVPTNAAQLRKPARFFLSRREQQGVRQVRCGPRRRRRRCAPRFGPRGACVRACVRVCLFGWRGSGGWLARAHVLVSCDGPSSLRPPVHPSTVARCQASIGWLQAEFEAVCGDLGVICEDAEELRRSARTPLFSPHGSFSAKSDKAVRAP